jgi:hypothetical protein
MHAAWASSVVQHAAGMPHTPFGRSERNARQARSQTVSTRSTASEYPECPDKPLLGKPARPCDSN